MGLTGIFQAAFSKINLSLRLLVGIVVASIVIYLIMIPLGVLVFSSFRATKELLPFEATTYTLNNYIQVFSSKLTYELLANTFQYALIALVIGLGLALTFSWFVERTNAPWRSVLVTFALAPLGVPGIVETIAWILLANPTNGIVNVWLRKWFDLSTQQGPINIYSIAGMGWITGLKLVPSAYIMLASIMARMDPALEEASLTSGASQFKTFVRITGSLMRPAILSVIILFGVLVIEMFETPAMLGIPRGIFVFSTLIYTASHPPMGLPDYGLASGYGIISLIIGAFLIYLYHRMVRRQEKFAVVTGKGYRPRPIVLKRGWQALFTGVMVVYILLSAVLPLLVLLWASFGILHRPFALGAATLDSYLQIADYPGIFESCWNTLLISIGSATGTMILSLLVAWLAVRSRFRGSWIPDRLTITAVAIPNIVIALALIFFYSHFPLPIYGTIWIIMIAHITRFLAYNSRVMNAAYLQIHKELEEASEACGATWATTMRKIVLPMLWPAFIRGWLWVFVHAIRDVSLALMLFAVYNQTLGVTLWQIWMEHGNFRLGAAIAVPLLLVSLGLSLLIVRPTMRLKEPGIR